MRLFLAECLSPRIARALNAEGVHVVQHPRDFGELGAPDLRVLARCLDSRPSSWRRKMHATSAPVLRFRKSTLASLFYRAWDEPGPRPCCVP